MHGGSIELVLHLSKRHHRAHTNHYSFTRCFQFLKFSKNHFNCSTIYRLGLYVIYTYISISYSSVLSHSFRLMVLRLRCLKCGENNILSATLHIRYTNVCVNVSRSCVFLNIANAIKHTLDIRNVKMFAHL